MPDVNIIEPTPILANSSIAIPGLKHHQLSFLETFPGIGKKYVYLLPTYISIGHNKMNPSSIRIIFLEDRGWADTYYFRVKTNQSK